MYLDMILYLIITGSKHSTQALSVTWGVGHSWVEPSRMYVNGVLTVEVPIQQGLTTHTVPGHARVIAWKFWLVDSINSRFYDVRYDNGWSASDYQCWKCTGSDVSQQDWTDIDYDDSAWEVPSANMDFHWVDSSAPTIYCRHTLPVSDGSKLELSNNQVVQNIVADKLQDDNTGTCVALREIYGSATTTVMKVNANANANFNTGGACGLTITGINLACTGLRVYIALDVEGSECPKTGPTSRLAATSQGSGSNGTMWCQFEYTPSTCGTCCVGCHKPVFVRFRGSGANIHICEIQY